MCYLYDVIIYLIIYKHAERRSLSYVVDGQLRCNYQTLIDYRNSINCVFIDTICVMYGRVALFRPTDRQPDQAVGQRRVGLRGCAVYSKNVA